MNNHGISPTTDLILRESRTHIADIVAQDRDRRIDSLRRSVAKDKSELDRLESGAAHVSDGFLSELLFAETKKLSRAASEAEVVAMGGNFTKIAACAHAIAERALQIANAASQQAASKPADEEER
ncbi:MAG TPA: hypothetical protein VK540_28755 [Polyangiaceae bacterium]|nr:hypothetical protein [Polyangiaceae bacterium]